MAQTFENRLKNSASPYLRSAAHQPIDWYEWGQEAFDKARTEGKPVLLDIGAVWCHWCHVIDRESYENPEIAALINKLFVPVKVDRDERPDVDSRYQSAVSAISGQGGWPLTAFLTPDGKPFYGGTYFPPEDMMGRPGFKRILVAISDAFQTRRDEVNTSAGALERAVAKAETYQEARGEFDPAVIEAIVASAIREFDETHGGFGNMPKFPHASAVDLLLERYQTTRDARLLHIAERTLEGMGRGGVYDQLAGGFHRYSVDERWCVPHFEKMTYDNSELLRNYVHGFQVTGNPFFREIAEGIVAWVGEVLSDAQRGGFYASQDADQTLDDDGDYFTWTVAEAREVLSGEEWRTAEIYYDIAPQGEMHHDAERNVLWVASTPEDLAKRLNVSVTDVRVQLARAKNKMLDARRKRRPVPMVDGTLYVGWNAMFVSAYLDAARVLGRNDCRDFALKTLERIISEAWDEEKGFLHRIGGPPLEGSLDDQVFAIAALLDAWEITLEPRYFELAQRSMRVTGERFGDPEGGGFFDRAKDGPAMGGLEVRRKPLQDSPTPGGNSMAVIVLDRLYSLTGERVYHEWAQKALEAFAELVPKYGLFAATYGLAALLHARQAIQIVVTGNSGDAQAAELANSAAGVYRYGKTLLRVTPQNLQVVTLPPALRDTLPNMEAATPRAYVCVERLCHPAVATAEELTALLMRLGATSR